MPTISPVFEVASGYVAELFAALRSYEYDPATTHLTIVGGGGQLVKHFGSYDPEQVTIVDDICAAAKVRVHGLPPDAPRVKPCRRYGRPTCGSTLAKSRSGKLWQYLQTMDKSVFKSYNQAVATAVVDYFDRYYQTQDDPYLETRAREEQFVQQIVDAVRDTLRETMPVFLAGCITGMAQNPAAVSPSL